MQNVRFARSVLTALFIAGLTLTTGCGPLVITIVHAPAATPAPGPLVLPVPGKDTPAAPATPVVPAAPGSTTPAPLPGPIGTGGTSTPVPPTVNLPAPEDSQARIARLVQAYGIKRIYGSMATGAMLDGIEEMLRRFPVGSLRDLDICCEPAEADPKEVADDRVLAYWTASNDGTKHTGGKMFLFRNKSDVPTLLHEASHHLTMYVDKSFGLALTGSLGYQFVKDYEKPTTGDADYKRIHGEWSATAVPATSYNSSYARTSNLEHIAELMMIHVGGELSRGEITNQAFQMHIPARQMMETKLGAARSTGGA